MKQNETIFRAKKKYFAIMFLCFLFGGFSLISFILQAYTVFWRIELVGFPLGERISQSLPAEARDLNIDSNRFDRARFFTPDPVQALLSPTSLFLIAGAVVSILAGIVIWSLVREKEIKAIKQETTNSLLLPDEKKIIDTLKKANFESTQSKLVKETGLSKVQVHRTIKRLESKGVLEKHNYGLTNKIILKKEFFE
ncbi:MAG: hypothetical protein PHD95_00415 [Candidatus ainarchaeum sp.]|nr:hypothetical protein [Candidatus ainarchaeum sp.]